MKIMTISDSPTRFSGLARVHRHVIDGFLEAGHTVLPCCWYALTIAEEEAIRGGKKPTPVYYDSHLGQVQLICLPRAGGVKEMHAIFEVVNVYRPDILVTIGDHWRFFYMQAIKVKTGFSFTWIPYLTVEHEVSQHYESVLRYADAIAVPSEYGVKELERVLPESPARFIPYGTEEAFSRVSTMKRRKIRRSRGCEGKVRFVTVAQNTWRKNLPALIQAVSLIAHRDPKRLMQFYLHTNVDAGDDEAYLYDLHELIRKMDVTDRFVLPSDGGHTVSVFESPDDSVIAEEYHAADFFVLPSTSEGYCLPVVEAMACGVVPIAHSSSTLPEHLGAEATTFGGKPPIGRFPRGFLSGGRLEVCPPSRFVNVVRPDALAQSIWDAFQMTKDKKGRKILSEMRLECETYGKGRGWGQMKRELCELSEGVAGKTVVPLEEL
jgi:glycosyltransferase involved in cell wall biosynthesis